MLPAFIIEEIRRKEEQHKRRDQPVLELPIPLIPRGPVRDESDEQDRGVVIIELLAG
jgi:hypothetical protein